MAGGWPQIFPAPAGADGVAPDSCARHGARRGGRHPAANDGTDDQRFAPPEVLVAFEGATGVPMLVALLLAPAPALLSAPLSLPAVVVPLIVLLFELRPLLVSPLLLLSW
jgi:hypothetical protein